VSFEGIADLPPTDQSGRASCLWKKVRSGVFLAFGAEIGIAKIRKTFKDNSRPHRHPSELFFILIKKKRD
jgi:hypothetical protein